MKAIERAAFESGKQLKKEIDLRKKEEKWEAKEALRKAKEALREAKEAKLYDEEGISGGKRGKKTRKTRKAKNPGNIFQSVLCDSTILVRSVEPLKSTTEITARPAASTRSRVLSLPWFMSPPLIAASDDSAQE